MDDEKLIELVRGQEILYNQFSRDYRLPDKKLKAWTTVAQQLGCTEEECRRRWTSLRERFSRECKRLNAPSGSIAINPENWCLFDNMSFLKKHIKQRPTRCKENILEDSCSSSPLLSSTHQLPQLNDEAAPSTVHCHLMKQRPTPCKENILEDSCSSSPLLSSSLQLPHLNNEETTAPYSPSSGKKRKELDLEKEFRKACQLFKTISQQKPKKTAVDAFGQMIVCTITSMSPRYQTKAMKKVTDLVMTLKSEDDEANCGYAVADYDIAFID